MKIAVGSRVKVHDPPEWLIKWAKTLRIKNPQRAQAIRFGSIWSAQKHPKWVYACVFMDDAVIIPRAAYFATVHPRMNGQRIEDVTTTTHVEYPEPKLPMLPHQNEAATKFMEYVNECDEKGIPADTTIIMATAAGKTVLGMYLASLCEERALIVVHTQEVESAWIKDAKKFFNVDKKDIGRIRAAKMTIGKRFTIGSVQTLMDLDPKIWRDEFGLVIFDEVHRHAAKCFSRVAERSRAHIRVGISASDTRKDGRMPVIRWHLGNNCYKDTTPRNSVPLHYHGVTTGVYIPPTNPDTGEYAWSDTCTRLCDEAYRTSLTVWLIEYIIQNYRGDILVATNRKAHAYELTAALIARNVSAVCLTGELTGREREKTYAEICKSEYRVTVGMLQIISDGANNPFWHHVINCVPFSDPKMVEQLKGRPIRKMRDKREAHFWDLIDEKIGMLNRFAKTRYREAKKHVVSVSWHEILQSDQTFTLRDKE